MENENMQNSVPEELKLNGRDIELILKCVDMTERVWYSWLEEKKCPEGYTEEVAKETLNQVQHLNLKLSTLFGSLFGSNDENGEAGNSEESN